MGAASGAARSGAGLAPRATARKSLALLIADLDGLKAINDLTDIAPVIWPCRPCHGPWRGGARQTDLPARIGGDEFALVAPSTSRPAAVALGERIRSLVGGQGLRAIRQ